LKNKIISGLIHGIICNSGSPLASWAIDTDPVKSAKAIGRLAGCLGAEETISQCLKNLTPEKLLSAYSAYSVEFLIKLNYS